MGTDKGLLTFNGRPMIMSVIDHIQPLCSEIIISSNNEEYNSFGYEVIMDEYDNLGPVAGILSTFPNANNETILLISCDLPYASTLFLKQLLLLSKKHEITLPELEDIVQPLCGIYSKKIISQIQIMALGGETRIQNLVKSFNLGIITNKELKEFDLKYELANMNTKIDILQFTDNT